MNKIICCAISVGIGGKPSTELVKEKLELDENGYTVADESDKTSVSGVHAVGEARTKSLRRMVTEAADGANLACETKGDLKALFLGAVLMRVAFETVLFCIDKWRN